MEGLNMLRSLTDMDQKAYPERLGKLFIVNSPFVFVKVYSMIKKWLDPGGKDKASFCCSHSYLLWLILVLVADPYAFNHSHLYSH